MASGSSVKATRREIKRAFGPAATTVIDAQGAVLEDTVLPALTKHRHQLEQQAHDLLVLTSWRQSFDRMTRWQRLKWVIGL